MPRKSADLHGNAPDKCRGALLLIDVINDLEFDGGEELLAEARPAAGAIAALKRRAKAAGVPAIYVNDNFGRWQSDLRALVRHGLTDGVRGEPLVRQLLPADDDYFVLKPKHSGFFQTALELLLEHLGATTLILTGFAGDICVLFTANDAYVRDFRLHVPADCTASETAEANRALELMEKVLRADLTPSAELDLEALVAEDDGGGEAKPEESPAAPRKTRERPRASIDPVIAIEDICEPEWAAWYRMTPRERWEESARLWHHYVAMGGSLDPEPDPQSPFYDPETSGRPPVDGRPGVRVVRRSGV